MRTKLLAMKSLFVLAGFLLFTNTLSARDWYVKPNASGEGSSWTDAVNISIIANTATPVGALTIADGDVVYMAAGTYESSTSKTVTKYISIMGGYPANLTGTNLPTRNLLSDSTIFVPSVGGTARCLLLNATTAPTVTGQKFLLDGLHFRGFNMATSNGGTALNINSSQSDIDFKNLSFKNNISLNATGGAVLMGSFAYNITISFDNCNFIGNQANYTTTNGHGGALYFNNGTTAKTINFTNCNFKNNSAYGRAGAAYFTSVITCNITDCVFDTNFSSNTTDNYASGNGGCFYIAGGTSANTFNLLRTIIVNSSATAKGSVFWFNTTPKNNLNLTNCSLIGSYASRANAGRAAIDCDSYALNLNMVLNGCLLSNYNNVGALKVSNKADVMNLASTSASTASTFTNSILNGVYFASSNTYDAVSPSLLYTTTGYLADSTINLALSGDLKITDKIVFKKTFSSGSVGTYTHAQIFDVKAKLNIPVTLIATIPAGYKLTVDAIDYSAGVKTITIAASASNPAISLSVDTSTGISTAQNNFANISASNGKVLVSDIKTGDNITVYNAAGQLLYSQSAKSNTMSIDAKGFVIVKINSGIQNQVTKLIVR